MWIGQGLGLIRGGSFMVDDLRWSVAGLLTVATGVALGWHRRRERLDS